MPKITGIGYSASLAEVVYELVCLRCRCRFYVKVEPENSHYLTEEEVLEIIREWDCDRHPSDRCLAEVRWHSLAA